MIRPLAKIKNLHYSGDRIQETGDRIQEIIFIYSPHFPTPHTLHPTLYVRNSGRRIRVNWEH
jgi:hypothetical protein